MTVLAEIIWSKVGGYTDENLKGTTVTAEACLMSENLIDAGIFFYERLGCKFFDDFTISG